MNPRRFNRAEDNLLVRRRSDGARDKVIARELGRSPSSVNNRLQTLRRRIREAHPDVLERHRQEELQLLRKLIAESSYPDGGEQ